MNNSYSNICTIPTEELALLEFAAISKVSVLLEGIVILLIYLVAFILNLFIGAVILTTKSLRQQRPLVLALQLISLNLLQALTWAPTAFVTGITGSWLLGGFVCKVIGFASLGLATYRWFVMFILCLDRFLSIYAPFKYPKFANAFTAMLIGVCLLFSSVHSLLPLLGFGCYAFSALTLSCNLTWTECQSVICNLYYIFVSASVFTLGGTVPLVMYVMMLRLAWKFRHSGEIGTLEGCEDRPRRAQIIKSEQRAMITFFVLFVTLVGLTLPFYSALLVNQVGTAFGLSIRLNVELFYLILDIYLLLPIGDAVVIAWNRDITKRIAEIFRRRKSRATQLNISSTTQSM